METISAALAGQPNVGKTSLLNALSSSHLKVGNFSGVTVEKTEVSIRYCDDINCKEYKIDFIDLPGAYSLNDYTVEERVTREFLFSDDYDVIINVIDSTNLQKNLLLTAELLELNQKTVVALNMIDEAKKAGIEIDEKQLSAILGVPCIKVSSKTKEGLDELKHAIVETYEKGVEPKIIYSEAVEEEIGHIVALLKEKNYQSDKSLRTLALLLLKEDKEIYKRMHEEPIWLELEEVLKKAKEHIYIHFGTKDMDEIFAIERQSFARGAALEVSQTRKPRTKTLSEKIDAILLNTYLGIPIFLFLMWGLFQLTFELGAIPMEYIDAFFAWLSEKAKEVLGGGELGSLIAEGIIAGVGAVVLFLPNIAILFLGIALLETTGYMSRVAFMLDGFFHRFGLHGKSFIPLVTGFGCSVPAYMAARTLKNEKERLITLFIIGFMSCGARLPVYVLFVGAFFGEERAGNILFLIYVSGALLGLVFAKLLKMFVFKGEDEPFVMEMPKYRLPSFRLIWHTVYGQVKSYLKKAGTFILVASVFIWFVSNYPKVETPETLSLETEKLVVLEHSYLARAGKVIEPFFEPLGYDWRMSVALLSGLAAKEVVVSTLGVLYALGEDVGEKDKGLAEAIRQNISLPSAISFIVFVMIYLPCFAASMVFAREAGGFKYLFYLFVFTTVSAWVTAFVAYRISLMFIGA